MPHCKIYASDEGFGHLVRQRAINDALVELIPDLKIDLQTRNQADAASWIFPRARVIRQFNNIIWPRHESGSPNLEETKTFYEDYIYRSDQFVEDQSVADYQFLISDFVYEVFEIARRHKIPAFGSAHFTWDWFFSKLYPSPVSSAVLDRMRTYAHYADALFFSEFSPQDIVAYYKKKAIVHPLIVRADNGNRAVTKKGFNVLIMDSGASVLAASINKAINEIPSLPDFNFFLSAKYGLTGDNVTNIAEDVSVIEYLEDMDLVISRGGFNTISECIAYRVPVLLLGEALNPEIERNMFFLKQEGLGSFVSLHRFSENFSDTLRRFIDGEYQQLKNQMQQHQIRTDGAQVVAEHIANLI